MEKSSDKNILLKVKSSTCLVNIKEMLQRNNKKYLDISYSANNNKEIIQKKVIYKSDNLKDYSHLSIENNGNKEHLGQFQKLRKGSIFSCSTIDTKNHNETKHHENHSEVSINQGYNESADNLSTLLHPDLTKNYELFLIRKDSENVILERKSYYQVEIEEIKKAGKSPLIIAANPKGQRDIGSAMFEVFQKYLLYNSQNEDLEHTNYPIFDYAYIETEWEKTWKTEKNFKKCNNEYLDEISIYLKKLFKKADIELSTIIIAYIYLDRIYCSKKIPVTINNFLNLIITCLYISYVYNEDEIYNQSLFSKLMKIDSLYLVHLSNILMNDILGWNLYVSPLEFRSYTNFPLMKYISKNQKLIDHINQKVTSKK